MAYKSLIGIVPHQEGKGCIALQNLKSHRSTQLALDGSRLYALVGQNSSGKTSILQALHCLCRLAGNENVSAHIFQVDGQAILVLSSRLSAATAFCRYTPRVSLTATAFQVSDQMMISPNP
ncbi:AAA family ATPase [Trichothermofontia sichuanensis]|uniref:AAA family ATPase n=1 Tax=Trichothermofontia sichuanensis TaxID=3045816 RepID=UPI0036F4374E